MITNYRSSDEIVHFYNVHITGDPGFASARILPAKPEVVSKRGKAKMPILGMFLSDPKELANCLADWLDNLLTHRRMVLGEGELFNNHNLHLPDDGDWA